MSDTMTWTTEKPKCPGWYWWRLDAQCEPVVLEVESEYPSLRVRLPYTFFKRKLYRTDGEWSGPLPLPKEER